MNTYTTNGVCSQAIQFEIKDNKVHHVTFIGGCHGSDLKTRGDQLQRPRHFLP